MGVPESYLEDASGYTGRAEKLLVPESEEDVVRIVCEAGCSQTPVTISGGGTGVTGGRVAQGGWVISMEKLTRLEVAAGTAVAGPGVLLRDLHRAAAQSGQLYPPDPTETLASVGGTIATNASGSRSFRYGSTRRWVDRLRVVLMSGKVLEIRRGQPVDFDVPEVPLPDTTKNTAGYPLRPGMDLVDLFIGSEGTLGIVTEATLRLIPAPAAPIAAILFFGSDEPVIAAVDRWRSIEGIRAIEYFDHGSLDLLRPKYPEIPASARAALMVEQEPAASEEEIDRWIDRAEQAGADLEKSWFAASDADRERFRQFRHAQPETVNDTVRREGYVKLNTDFAVPLAHNAKMLTYYHRRLEEEFPGQYVVFGHIGDAHLHCNVLPASDEQVERAKRLIVEFAKEAVRLGGTVSAEHGLGKRKRELLEIQYSPDQIEAMRAVKSRFDTDWLLGRETLFALR